jgi:hypothetical protein
VEGFASPLPTKGLTLHTSWVNEYRTGCQATRGSCKWVVSWCIDVEILASVKPVATAPGSEFVGHAMLRLFARSLVAMLLSLNVERFTIPAFQRQLDQVRRNQYL